MNIAVEGPGTAPGGLGPRGRARGGPAAYWEGVRAVVAMELRQRLRSRGWAVLLAIWFLAIGLVTWLTWWSTTVQYRAGSESGAVGQSGTGSLIFEVVLAFVLLFGLLVAPAFSANAVNGDRAAGTLAILQVTLLRPGQILWGKFLASWAAALAFLVASFPFLLFAFLQGGLGAAHIIVALVMLAVELGVVCALGVGISALAGRPLFSIVVSYLVVAALVVGTLIAFGLGSLLSQGSVSANQVFYKNMYVEEGPGGPVTSPEAPALPSGITEQNSSYACYGPLVDQPAVRTDRVAWMLGMNPFVVVADAIPYPQRSPEQFNSQGAFKAISQGARSAQAGPGATYQCAGGKVAPSYIGQKTPLWPLGLGLQLVAAAGILALGWRALRTPARKLPRGMRVA